MSDLNSNDDPAAVIATLRTGISRLLAAGTLWGMHMCLSITATTIFVEKSRHCSSIVRRCRFALILLMQGLATAYTIHLWWYEHGHVTAPYDGGLANLCIATVIYFVSDLIVIWRAWILWPNNICVKGVLVVVSMLSVGCAIPGLYSEGGRDAYEPVAHKPFLPPLLGFFPFMLTNTVATGLVAYKAWIYRFEVHAFLNPDGTNTSTRSGSRLGRVFVLLIEGGAVYTIMWAIYLGAYLSPSHPEEGASAANMTNSEFFKIWEVIMVEISAMYPAVIMILVSRLMTQCDAVNGTYTGGRRDEELQIEFARRGTAHESIQVRVNRVQFDTRSISDSPSGGKRASRPDDEPIPKSPCIGEDAHDAGTVV